MRINFDFSDLEAFLAVMETGSFHAAGEKLSLSQSAVTRRIQKLEVALDSELFERTTRAVKPTLAAKRLLDRAAAILEDARETTLALRDESVAFAHQRNAVITLAILPTLVARVIPAAIREFRDAGFATRVRLLDMAANEVAEAVAQGSADFGLSSVPAGDPGTEFEPLFDDPMVLALPASHRLLAWAAIRWADLEGEALVLPMRGTGNRLLIDDAMARARLPRGWTFEVLRTTTALELVRGGSGVAILPRSALAARDQSGVAHRPMPAPGITRPVGLLTRSGETDRPATAALKAALRAHCRTSE